MSQESGSDPWDEMQGLPPRVKEYRTPPGEERSWETTLNEVRQLATWLWLEVMMVRTSLEMPFDNNIHMMTLEPSGNAFKMYHYILTKMDEKYKPLHPVQELLMKLLSKVRDEVTAALQATQSGLDE